MIHRLFTATLVSLLCGGILAPQSEKSQSRHAITFTFDYDFRITPACSAEIKKDCVQKFNFYDISLGIARKVPLGSRPVPTDAMGLKKDITFTTEQRLFKTGTHMVAVAAQLDNGLESDLQKCSVTLKMQ